MKRRRFIRSVGSIVGASALPTTSVAGETTTSRPPEIAQAVLDAYGWEQVGEVSELPSFTDEDHIENVEKTTFRLNAYHSTDLSEAIERATPLQGVRPLKHLWAARVTTDDKETEAIWNEGETAEAAAGIDGTTEEAFERYIEGSILEGNVEFHGEWHRKAVEEASGSVIGEIPIVGSGLATVFSWKWNLTTTITTKTGNTSHISEYYFSLPLSSISASAQQKIETETSLDFRGMYVDWFAEGNVFYAAGGIYPEDEARLNEQLSDGFDEGLLDFDPPEFNISTDEDYEQEMLQLLREVR